MKKLLLLLLIIPIISFSQEKGDTKIIVKAKDTTNLFNRIVLYLYENGYTLETKDETAKFLMTAEKPLNKITSATKTKFLIKDDLIIMSGLFALNASPAIHKTFDVLDYRKLSSHLHHKAWKEMEQIAKEFGTIIRYE